MIIIGFRTLFQEVNFNMLGLLHLQQQMFWQTTNMGIPEQDKIMMDTCRLLQVLYQRLLL